MQPGLPHWSTRGETTVEDRGARCDCERDRRRPWRRPEEEEEIEEPADGGGASGGEAGPASDAGLAGAVGATGDASPEALGDPAAATSASRYARQAPTRLRYVAPSEDDHL